jgi:hypothetical protein
MQEKRGKVAEALHSFIVQLKLVLQDFEGPVNKLQEQAEIFNKNNEEGLYGFGGLNDCYKDNSREDKYG